MRFPRVSFGTGFVSPSGLKKDSVPVVKPNMDFSVGLPAVSEKKVGVAKGPKKGVSKGPSKGSSKGLKGES